MRAFIVFSILSIIILSCKNETRTTEHHNTTVRHQEDTIGFAQYSWQLDSIISRMDSTDKVTTPKTYKAVICPHDDYGYAGGLYYKTLSGIKAKTVILVGVAHRARNFELQDKIIFGSYDSWQAPYGPIKISPLRDALLKELKTETYVVHDSMMQLEHSLEAITPFLQKRNPNLEILPMLVPYNTFEAMQSFSDDIAQNLNTLMEENNLSFGDDVAIVISNDAIHYGSTGWSTDTMAPFGVDSLGTAKARAKDLDIIERCLEGKLTTEKIKVFNDITVMPDDYKAYNWTWCGRYSTPFGLLLANRLNTLSRKQNLNGTFIDWRSSIHGEHIKVDDLRMGHTAAADSTHWVAYVGMAYE